MVGMKSFERETLIYHFITDYWQGERLRACRA
jgi:hypothetical protein